MLHLQTDIVRLRYLTAAYKYRHRAAFAYVRLTDPDAHKTVRRFRVSDKLTTLLLFQEIEPGVADPTPAASAAVDDLDLASIDSLVGDHQFLRLPRLSSQGVLDALCPPGSTRVRKRICVALISRSGGGGDPDGQERHRQALRDFQELYRFSPERVRFAYVLADRQPQFVRALSNPAASPSSSSSSLLIDSSPPPSDPTLHVAVLWRRDYDVVKFDWVKGRTIRQLASYKFNILGRCQYNHFTKIAV